MDASSKYQNSLPVSSDHLLRQLDEWKITYKCYKHVPLKTVEESKKVQSKLLNFNEGGGHIKNLYLRDNKKRNFLIITEQDCKIDLRILKEKIGSGRLSFGSSERLMEYLGVRSGAVSPFSMIVGVTKNINLYIDKKLKSCLKIYAHPLVNDRTLELSLQNLELFFNKIGADPNWIEFDD